VQQQCSCHGLGLAICQGSQRDGGWQGGVDTIVVSGVDRELKKKRDLRKKQQNLTQFTRGAMIHFQLYLLKLVELVMESTGLQLDLGSSVWIVSPVISHCSHSPNFSPGSR
jgi:hypothetical protein